MKYRSMNSFFIFNVLLAVAFSAKLNAEDLPDPASADTVSAIQLDNVVVTADRGKAKTLDMPYSVTLLSKKTNSRTNVSQYRHYKYIAVLSTGYGKQYV